MEVKTIVTQKSVTVRVNRKEKVSDVVALFSIVLKDSSEFNVIPYETGADIVYYGRKSKCFDLLVALAYNYKVDMI